MGTHDKEHCGYFLYRSCILCEKIHIRAGGTGPVGPAKTGPLSSMNSVMIVAFINVLSMNVVISPQYHIICS